MLNIILDAQIKHPTETQQINKNIPVRGGLCECRLQGMLTINLCSGTGRTSSDFLLYKPEQETKYENE